MWRTFWFPALISNKKLKPSLKYEYELTKISKVYIAFNNHVKNIPKRTFFTIEFISKFISERPHLDIITQNSKFKKLSEDHLKQMKKINPNVSKSEIGRLSKKEIYSEQLTMESLIYGMIKHGNQIAMMNAYENGYTDDEKKELIENLKHTTFSFTEFLQHVIWSYEIGIENIHWVQFQALCGRCYHPYDYILHLDNIDEEGRDFFHRVGYPLGTNFGSKHRVGNVIKDKKYSSGGNNLKNYGNYHSNKTIDYNKEYYSEIPSAIIDKLRRIFLVDFLTFGYSIP